jgi:beta-glucosidase
LKPGASQAVSFAIEPRIVAEYVEKGWVIVPGTYSFAMGENAERLGSPLSIKLPRPQD